MEIIKKLKKFFMGKREKEKDEDYIEDIKSEISTENKILEDEQAVGNTQEENSAKEIDNAENKEVIEEIKDSSNVINLETILYDKLKEYRLRKSKEENLVEHFVFKNKEIEDIIKTKPKTVIELKSIRGFGEVKCRKYGEDIINIINEI